MLAAGRCSVASKERTQFFVYLQAAVSALSHAAISTISDSKYPGGSAIENCSLPFDILIGPYTYAYSALKHTRRVHGVLKSPA
jgi:hypothetical protein